MTVRDFYDRITPFYHLIYGEWDASVERQGGQIDSLVRETWPDVKTVLDVSCGIGTQAIGLARRGYRVTGLDISPPQIERGRKEADRHGVTIDLHVADMREASRFGEGSFDLVISGDNAIPHLLTDEEILGALREFHRCLRPGGGLWMSVRDYDQFEREGTRVHPYGVREEDGVRYVVFQVWSFDGPCYDMSMYFIEDPGNGNGNDPNDGDGEVRTHVMRTRYYAISTDRLLGLIREAGFTDPRRLDDRFFQPVLIATRP